MKTNALPKEPTSLTGTWLALLALTCGSYLLSERETSPLFIFSLAWIKLTLVSAVFMELKHCRPLFLRLALALYTATIFVIVIA